MAIKYTQQQLSELKEAAASGILKVRKGDDWVEYQSINQMRGLIADMEEALKVQSRPKGARKVQFSSGR
ncbi:MAG: hypothetical protein GY829_05880 [Gammaproteobacteria bacterium]|nr:hypothetical protein [Gammaproteobacteria bacterium]MCP4881134.1 hypothetical protein [Gammaproteobacteria bacterium]